MNAYCVMMTGNVVFLLIIIITDFFRWRKRFRAYRKENNDLFLENIRLKMRVSCYSFALEQVSPELHQQITEQMLLADAKFELETVKPKRKDKKDGN